MGAAEKARGPVAAEGRRDQPTAQAGLCSPGNAGKPRQLGKRCGRHRRAPPSPPEPPRLGAHRRAAQPDSMAFWNCLSWSGGIAQPPELLGAASTYCCSSAASMKLETLSESARALAHRAGRWCGGFIEGNDPQERPYERLALERFNKLAPPRCSAGGASACPLPVAHPWRPMARLFASHMKDARFSRNPPLRALLCPRFGRILLDCGFGPDGGSRHPKGDIYGLIWLGKAGHRPATTGQSAQPTAANIIEGADGGDLDGAQAHDVMGDSAAAPAAFR